MVDKKLEKTFLKQREELREKWRAAVERYGPDSVEAQLVKEDLIVINHKLGYLTRSNTGVNHKFRGSTQTRVNQKILEKWVQGESTNAEERNKMFHIMEHSKGVLTKRQRELLEMKYIQKLTLVTIAERLGVDKSTISRTIKRAEAKMKRIAQANLIAGKCETPMFLRDLRMDRDLREKVLSVLPDLQRKYFEAYYFKGLTQLEIAEKFGVDKSTVSRVVSRARENLKKTFPDWDDPGRARHTRNGV